MEAEKEAIRREYEGRLAEMRSQYMEEQSGRTRLQQDLLRVQQEYEDKLAQAALKGEVVQAQGEGPAATGSSPPSGVQPTAQVALIRVCVCAW